MISFDYVCAGLVSWETRIGKSRADLPHLTSRYSKGFRSILGTEISGIVNLALS